MMDVDWIRAETPCKNVYLDHTAASVSPTPVLSAIRRYLDEIAELGPKAFSLIDRHYQQIDQTRAEIAKLVGAAGPETIALFTSGSEAIAATAGALSWQPSDEVILSDAEMISNVAPWLRLRDRFGVQVRFAPIIQPGLIDVSGIERLLSNRTRLISVTHVPNTLGLVQPLESIGRLARQAGVLFMVDAAASVGVVPIDVQVFQCDVLVGTGRKYLRGPAGSAFLYLRRDVLNVLEPMAFGWKTGAWDWDNHALTFPSDATRFHSGEPNFAPWIGLGAAVQYVSQVGGVEAIAERVRQLSEVLIERIAEMPHVRLIGPQEVSQRNGIIMVDVDGIAPKVAADFLQARGVVVEGGHGYCPGPLRLHGVKMALRLALHYWNTVEDIDLVSRLLAKVKS